MIRIIYVVSYIDKALAFEWLMENMPKAGYEVCFILLNPGDSDLERFFRAQKLPVERVRCRGKRDWPSAVWQIRKLLVQWKPAIVHCHLLQAGIVGLTAARLAGIRHRIYTRHHSSQHHVYNRRGILLDRYCNRIATRIVAVSGLVRRILTDWEKVPSGKVTLIPHGFCLSMFYSADEQLVHGFRERNQLGGQRPVVGVISRFIELKGVQYILPAFRSFRKRYPEAVLLLLNARGEYEAELRKELDLLPASSYRCIQFEPDISSVYPAMDIFLHVPVDDHSEAFGQIYVEALAAGVPSIFTLSGIAPDFIKDGENAIVVPYRDSDAIYDSLLRLWENPSLRMRLSESGPVSVQKKFDLPVMINALDNLYKQCLNPC